MPMSLKNARIISILFHPVCMLVYMLLFALQLQIQQTVLSLPHLLWLYGMLLAGYIILPAITVFLLYKLRIIKSLKLDNKQDNAIAYLIFALFYYLCFQSVSFYAIYPLIQIYMLIPILITASYLIIHLFYNINAHALFIGAIIGFFIGLGYYIQQNNIWIILILICISGWMLSAQMIINKHSSLQIYSGFFVGLSELILLFMFLA
jgi:membrane-associated HD superfamily phosphohydrolase